MQTKFQIGDIILDTLIPVGQKDFAIADIREDGPIFCKRIWYILVPNRTNPELRDVTQGLQSTIEEPGRFELVGHDYFWDK